MQELINGKFSFIDFILESQSLYQVRTCMETSIPTAVLWMLGCMDYLSSLNKLCVCLFLPFSFSFFLG